MKILLGVGIIFTGLAVLFGSGAFQLSDPVAECRELAKSMNSSRSDQALLRHSYSHVQLSRTNSTLDWVNNAPCSHWYAKFQGFWIAFSIMAMLAMLSFLMVLGLLEERSIWRFISGKANIVSHQNDNTNGTQLINLSTNDQQPNPQPNSLPANQTPGSTHSSETAVDSSKKGKSHTDSTFPDSSRSDGPSGTNTRATNAAQMERGRSPAESGRTAPVLPEIPRPDRSSGSQYRDMTVSALRNIARQRGIDLQDTNFKLVMVQILEESDAARNTVQSEPLQNGATREGQNAKQPEWIEEQQTSDVNHGSDTRTTNAARMDKGRSPVELERTGASVPETSRSDGTPDPEYRIMTIEQLREIAYQRGIAFHRLTVRDTMVRLLEEFDATQTNNTRANNVARTERDRSPVGRPFSWPLTGGEDFGRGDGMDIV
jgi:hypothetical protein